MQIKLSTSTKSQLILATMPNKKSREFSISTKNKNKPLQKRAQPSISRKPSKMPLIQEDGFSLLEFVITVSILGILTAIALPRFLCTITWTEAVTALAALKEVKKECSIKELRNLNIYEEKLLTSYSIQSDGSRSCEGAQGTGLIAAVPRNLDTHPEFLLNTNNGSIKYRFGDEVGEDLNECFGLICGEKPSHNEQSDPIHGDACTGFRTSMWHGDPARGGRLKTGCYGDPSHPKAVNSNGWIPDPCANTQFGCLSYSVYTRHGWYPCTDDGKRYKFNLPNGFPTTYARSCSDAGKRSQQNVVNNVYCWPPRPDCS